MNYLLDRIRDHVEGLYSGPDILEAAAELRQFAAEIEDFGQGIKEMEDDLASLDISDDDLPPTVPMRAAA